MKDTLGTSTLQADKRLLPETNFVLGSDPIIRRIGKHAERASEVECTVLISGETGTGKEVWAKRIHSTGPRSSRPFIPVNCAALTSTLAKLD